MNSQIEKLILEYKKNQLATVPLPEKFKALNDQCLEISNLFYKLSDLDKAFDWINEAQKYCEKNFYLHYQSGAIALELKKMSSVAEQWSYCIHENVDNEIFNHIFSQTISMIADPKNADPCMLELFSKILFELSDRLDKKQAALLNKQYGKKNPLKIAEELALLANEKDPNYVYICILKFKLAKNKEKYSEAISQLELYLKLKSDPMLQAQMRLLRLENDELLDSESEASVFNNYPSARSYYNAGVYYQNARRGLSQESKEFNFLETVAKSAYAISLQQYEKHFVNFDGGCEDGDLHIYSMCCRNRAMLARQDKEFDFAIELHTKGISTSPFFEHYNERSHNYYDLKRFEESGADSEIIIKEYIDNLDPFLTVIHYYRAIRGYVLKNQFSLAKPLANESLNYVDTLSSAERNSLHNQLPALYDLCATVFTKVGDTQTAEKLRNQISQLGPSLADVKSLLDQATEFLKKQQWSDALPLFKEVNRIQPTNIDALNWRLWILATLKNQQENKTSINSEIKELCISMLNITTMPSDSWVNIGKLALVKAYESALANLAWLEYENAETQKELLASISMIDEALSEVYNNFRSDDLAYLHDSKNKIVSKIQDLFADLKIQKQSYYFFGPKAYELKPLAYTYLGEYIKESFSLYFKFSKNQNLNPTNEDFQIDPNEMVFGHKLLALDKKMNDIVINFCNTPEYTDVPEIGILSNLTGNTSLIEYALEVLKESILAKKEHKAIH